VPLVIVVRAGLNINDMSQFSAALKTGKLMFGTAGVAAVSTVPIVGGQSGVRGTRHAGQRGSAARAGYPTPSFVATRRSAAGYAPLSRPAHFQSQLLEPASFQRMRRSIATKSNTSFRRG
jgi:hypothetical protein